MPATIRTRLAAVLLAALPLTACDELALGPDENLIGVTVSVAGIGASGVITSQPAGISCRLVNGEETGICGAGFRPGATVTLTATPTGNGNALVDWGDDCNTATTTSCTLRVTEPMSVTATFARTAAQ